MKLLICLLALFCAGCATPAPPPVIDPRPPFPPLNLEDTVPGHIIKDLLVENHFPADSIHYDNVRYTLVTEAWIETFGGRLKEATRVYGKTNSLADFALGCANIAFRQQYPQRFTPFADRYRMYPFYGVAFGEVQYDGRDVNFYVTRNSSGSLGLHLWNSRLRRPCYMIVGQPEVTRYIHY
jgi:hypothetical protein